MSRSALLIIAASLAAVLAGCGQGGPTTLTSGQTARVVRVVDGDTMIVSLRGREERVRFTGIDTPETVKPDAPVECYGPQASAETKRLLEGRSVRLELDVEQRDRYGRLLAYIFRSPDNLFVNRELIAAGFAERFRNTVNRRYVGAFEQAESAARQAGRGLWGTCPRSSHYDSR